MEIYKRGLGNWARGLAAIFVGLFAIYGCRALFISLFRLEWEWPTKVLFILPVLTMEITIAHLTSTGVFLLCLGVIFMLMNHKRLADFLIETENEMKKVSWPVKEDEKGLFNIKRYSALIGSSVVVIISVIVIGIVLFVYDVFMRLLLDTLIRL